jgi:hypothetical protein
MALVPWAEPEQAAHEPALAAGAQAAVRSVVPGAVFFSAQTRAKPKLK